MAAEPTDVADLFPPSTLAYAELTNPAALAGQLSAVFQGTALEDSIALIHKRKDAATSLADLQGKRELAALGLLVSPEMMAEFKKLRGVAVGLVGFSETGEPEAALVVLTSDSPGAGLAARAFLTMTPNLRKVAEVAKVPIFQYRPPAISYDMMGMPVISNDKPPMESAHDLTFAYTPGLFVVGTSKFAISHAIERFLGDKQPGLAGTRLFQEAAAIYRQPGIFYVVNFPEFEAKTFSANKVKGGMAEPDVYAWFKMVANPKAIKSIAGNIRFHKGGLLGTSSLAFDPKSKSPLVDFLSGPGVKLAFLHQAQRPTSLAFAATWPEKNRAASVVGFLDALAKANGQIGKLPSDVVKELADKHKLPINEELLNKTAAMTLVIPTRQELPKGTKPLPLLVLHTDDEVTAKAWEEFLPKLIGELSGAATPPRPSSELVGGIKVFSLAGSGLPWHGPIHYAHSGQTVVLGLDRKLVSAAVLAEPSTSLAGGDKALHLPPGEPCALFGAVSLLEAYADLNEKQRPEGQVVPAEPPLGPGGNNAIPIPESVLEDLKKARKEFLTAAESLPPATFLVRRVGTELRLEIFQPTIEAATLKPLIASGVNWLDKWSGVMASQNAQGIEGRTIFSK